MDWQLWLCTILVLVFIYVEFTHERIVNSMRQYAIHTGFVEWLTYANGKSSYPSNPFWLDFMRDAYCVGMRQAQATYIGYSKMNMQDALLLM